MTSPHPDQTRSAGARALAWAVTMAVCGGLGFVLGAVVGTLIHAPLVTALACAAVGFVLGQAARLLNR